MNLILVEPEDVAADGIVTLADDRARHIREVLGKQAGDTVRIGVVEGGTGEATVLAWKGDAVELLYEERSPPPPRPPVDLLLAMPRPPVMKRLWITLATLGVGHIYVTGAQRVERCYFTSHALRPEIIRPRLLEGLMQAGDTRLPTTTVHRSFRRLLTEELEAAPAGDARVVLDLQSAPPLASLVLPPHHTRILLAVGPEGGWSDRERELLLAHGFEPRGLGPRILRTDTACTAGVLMAHHCLRAEFAGQPI